MKGSEQIDFIKEECRSLEKTRDFLNKEYGIRKARILITPIQKKIDCYQQIIETLKSRKG